MKHKLLLLMFFIGMMICQGQVTSVAIVGEAAGGWPGSPGNPGPEDINQMTSTDGENWTLNGLTLNASTSFGEIKFRANNAWDINWGAVEFPTGTATQGGANIICFAGTYDVTFNSTTGAYSFSGGTPPPTVIIVGAATGTVDGIVMNFVGSDTYRVSNVTLLEGSAQFSIDDVLGGAPTFPAGTLIGSSSNIPIIAAAYSSITLNIETGDYSFVYAPISTNSNVTISGSSVGGSSVNITMTTSDGVNHIYNNLSTTQGDLLFNINTDITETYGNQNFPAGIATLDGDAIQIPSGTWTVNFNSVSKTYSFTGNPEIPSISIVGSGAGGWPGDPNNPGPYDINQMTTDDGITYTIYSLEVTEGEVKFRQNNEWTLNWGVFSFPSGIGTQGGSNIFITTAGTYTVTFNRISGEFDFSTPTTIAIVGTGAGGWPTGAPGEIDANRLETTDGINFRLNGITLTDGEVKFRQNNSWDVFWGGTSLTGTLILNGPSIPTIAGTYTISMNRDTGDYSLSSGTFTKSFFTVYPNPTQSILNVVSDSNTAIVSIEIFDTLGKIVMGIKPNTTAVRLEIGEINAGLYFVKIATANGFETIKLMKN